VLFGTGLRNHQTPVTAYIGATVAPGFTQMDVVQSSATQVPAEYAGAQPQFDGLDQVNLLLPTTLAGSGTMYLQLVVDGYLSNTLQLQFQ
jgi:uncharacterized protein (TIGR03437 family)